MRYRFALNEVGKLVDARCLAAEDVENKTECFCIACGCPLIAKVRGTKRQPHFSHHPGTTCTEETYLHRLGKKVFEEVYRNCLAEELPFEIEINHGFVCRNFEGYTGTVCVLDRIETKSYDLTKYFRSVKCEQRLGEFVPDLLIFDEVRPDRRVFIEIAVTHFLSERKERSNERIIEIPIRSEDDLESIRSRRLSKNTASFVNFATNSHAITGDECRCASMPAQAFIVYSASGECHLAKGTLAEIIAKRTRNESNIAYFRLRGFGGGLAPDRHEFRDALEEAHHEGVSIKNCYLCRYQVNNRKGEPGRPVYCKLLNITCNSNHAVMCNAFRLTDRKTS